MESISSTTCPRSDASAMPAAIRTISSSTIRQGVGIQIERNTAPWRASSGPWSTVGEEPCQEFLRGAHIPGSRQRPRRHRRFGGVTAKFARNLGSMRHFALLATVGRFPIRRTLLDQTHSGNASSRQVAANSRTGCSNPVTRSIPAQATSLPGSGSHMDRHISRSSGVIPDTDVNSERKLPRSFGFCVPCNSSHSMAWSSVSAATRRTIGRWNPFAKYR
jgi:hypothetical protein